MVNYESTSNHYVICLYLRSHMKSITFTTSALRMSEFSSITKSSMSPSYVPIKLSILPCALPLTIDTRVKAIDETTAGEDLKNNKDNPLISDHADHKQEIPC